MLRAHAPRWRSALVLCVALVAGCPRPAPTDYRGTTNGRVTTFATVTCPGQAGHTSPSIVTLAQCSRGLLLDVAVNDIDLQCDVTDTLDHATEQLTFSKCTPGTSLSSGTLVPELFLYVDAKESYLKGTTTVGGQLCTVAISGPLYADSDYPWAICPCDLGGPDGGCRTTDGGFPDAGDGGP